FLRLCSLASTSSRSSSLSAPPPCSTLFPYTTLFRSRIEHATGQQTGLVQLLVEPKAAPVLTAALRERGWDGRGLGLHEELHQARDRKSTRLNSSHVKTSYAVFCLKKKSKAK